MEPDSADNSPRIANILLWWTIICSLAAAPSFVLGCNIDGAVGGMLAGVATYIIGYTLISLTLTARRLYANRIWRRTIHITYGTRIALSLLSVFAFIGVPFAMIIDIWSGMVATTVAERIVGGAGGFVFAYLATIIEGAILNFVLFVFMMMVWTVARMVMTPEDSVPRGFDVIPVANVVEKA